MQNLKTVLSNNKGSIYIGTIAAILFILIFTATIYEICKMSSVYQNVEYNMQRAANSAVEYCVKDDYRSDESIHLNTNIVNTKLLEYVRTYLGLNSSYKREVNGETVYYIKIAAPITANSSPAQLKFEVRLFIGTSFGNLINQGFIELPVKVYSTNLRIGDIKPVQSITP